MLVLDIETLGVESNSVVLSVGMVYVNDTSPKSYNELLDNAIFVKLNAKEQIENYKRVVSKDTVDWWMKQSEMARERNFIPKPTDLSVTEAISILKTWVAKVSKKGDHCWIRGSLDQVCLDSLFRAAGESTLLDYNVYRDVRTAIDLLYPETSKNGYVDVDPNLCIGFDRSQVLKHSPEHDCAFDAAMLLYGVK
jgi:hypothetical protein